MAYCKPKGRSEASGSLIQFPDARLFKPQNKQYDASGSYRHISVYKFSHKAPSWKQTLYTESNITRVMNITWIVCSHSVAEESNLLHAMRSALAAIIGEGLSTSIAKQDTLKC